MVVDPETRQRLLELYYELLPDEEAAALRRRLEAEPELARAYAEAEEMAGVLARAARWEEPKLVLQRPELVATALPPLAAGGSAKRAAARARLAARQSEPLAKRRYRGMTWIVAIAAGVLLLISLGGIYYHHGQLADIAADHLRLRVVGPSRLQQGVGHHFDVITTSLTGTPAASQVELALFASDGQPLLTRKERTNEAGRLELALPTDLPLGHRVRLEITATQGDKHEQMVTQLEVTPTREATTLGFAKRRLQPGEAIYFRSVTLSNFGFAAMPSQTVQYEVRDPQGRVVPGSRRQAIVRDGVGSQRWLLPSTASDGTYTVVASTPAPAASEARGGVFVQRALPEAKGDSAATSSKPGGPVPVHFAPEGGELVAGLENRVFFFAVDPQGHPVALRGNVLDSQNNLVALAEADDQGRGTFTLTPQGNDQYRLKVLAPEGVSEEPKLPAVSNGDVVLTTGLGVFAAGQPLEFNVRAKTAGIPLVASAVCRGVAVGQQALVTKVGANAVQIAVDEQVGGVVQLVLFDYRSSPPKPVAQRLVYRRPTQRLEVHSAGTAEAKLGETMRVALTVTDEHGVGVPALLGVSVVDEAATGEAGPPRPSLMAQYLLGQVLDPSPANLDAYLADDPKAAVALDLLLGTQGAGIEPENPQANTLAMAAPPAVFDNLTELQERYKDTLARYWAHRSQPQNSLTMLSIFGGLGLVLFVTLLAIMNVRTGARLWGPALGAATACAVIGMILMRPQLLQSMPSNTVAFLPYQAPTLGPSAPMAKELAGEPNAPAGLADEYRRSDRATPLEASAPPAKAGGGDLVQQETKTTPAASKSLPVPLATTPAPTRALSAGKPPAAAERPAANATASDADRSASVVQVAPESLAPALQEGDVALKGYGAVESRTFQKHAEIAPAVPEDRSQGVLYWNPALSTDEQGRVELEFALPATPGSYRVIVDAQANGRLGSLQTTITTSAP